MSEKTSSIMERSDYWHKLSCVLVDKLGSISFGPLNVASMVKNHGLTKSALVRLEDS
jgi:hypothetical protein